MLTLNEVNEKYFDVLKEIGNIGAGNATAKRISIVETTLSFAIKPLIRDVTTLQSPRPSGLKIGTRTPAIAAMIELSEFSTKLR